MEAETSAIMTAAKAGAKFWATPCEAPDDAEMSAGPIGIIVATRPSMGAIRLHSRNPYNSLRISNSSDSMERVGSSGRIKSLPGAFARLYHSTTKPPRLMSEKANAANTSNVTGQRKPWAMENKTLSSGIVRIDR